jgi:putative alpha-1,2-mannosidase
MTRWVAQTRQNYVSVTPYNYSDIAIHGFQGTHQPAIWMGESAQVVVVPGAGQITPRFEDRGMEFSHDQEVLSSSYYSVELRHASGGQIFAEQSASKFHLSLSFRVSCH